MSDLTMELIHPEPKTAEASRYTADQLHDRTIHRRAVEAVNWGMAAVNFELMFDEMAKLGGKYNQIVYWSKLLDWKNQTLTPNPDVIYLMPFFDTREVGPLVLEIPPADGGVFNGSLMDFWQAAIEDIGPGGVDKGKGGKYLFFGPDFSPDQVPEGYIPMPSQTSRGYALIRSVLKSGSAEDLAAAIAYSTRMKLYPLSQAADPPKTVYIDAAGKLFDSTIRYDLSFFELLNRAVQAEPFLERDKAMIDPLKSISIERGKPFAPDQKTRDLLEDAIAEAHEWIESRYGKLPPFYEGKRWFSPIDEEFHQAVMHDFHVPDSYPTDLRGSVYSLAFFSAKHVGGSQYYLLTGSDRHGAPLDGAASYRLNVPADAPITQYWSVTVYDRDTHAFIREMPREGRSSQSPGLQWNADGSADIYFGPRPPDGKDSNWIPTKAGRGFEVLARFYGPKPALFDKSWQIGDLERVA